MVPCIDVFTEYAILSLTSRFLQKFSWSKEQASFCGKIDQFRYIKIQPKTIDLSARRCGITTEFVGFIPQSLVLRSIVLGWILIYNLYLIFKFYFPIKQNDENTKYIHLVSCTHPLKSNREESRGGQLYLGNCIAVTRSVISQPIGVRNILKEIKKYSQ